MEHTQKILNCAELAELPCGSSVAVVTLLGSLCPITLGHVQTFLESRRLLLAEAESSYETCSGSRVPRPARLPRYAAVLGLISLNGSQYVERKLHKKQEASLTADQRQRLVELAIEPYPWLGMEAREGELMSTLRTQWPQLKFTHFFMNGADDVKKHRKWTWASENERYITMGRPGDTEAVVASALRDGVDLEGGTFIMGPELPDISSSLARQMLSYGDTAGAASYLAAPVLDWLVQHGPWQPKNSQPPGANR